MNGKEDLKVDLSCLSKGTLVRYKVFFKLSQQNDENLHNKNELAELVNNHFNNFEIIKIKQPAGEQSFFS